MQLTAQTSKISTITDLAPELAACCISKAQCIYQHQCNTSAAAAAHGFPAVGITRHHAKLLPNSAAFLLLQVHLCGLRGAEVHPYTQSLHPDG
jgi:hypothetical protein